MDVTGSHRAPAFLAAVALGLSFLLPGCALAQSAGNGVRVGDGRLHPAVDLEVRYDSAAGFFRVPSGALELSSEAVTHIRPRVKFEMPSEQLAVGLDAELDLIRYTGLVTPGSVVASRVEGGANLGLAFNPTGNLTAELSNQIRRSDRNISPSLGIGVLSLWNETRLGGIYRPSGGALEVEPSVAYAVEGFEAISSSLDGCTDASCDPAQLEGLAYRNLFAGVTGRWRFLPKTAIVLETAYEYRTYRDADLARANLFRTSLGLAGMLSQRIALVAKAGWSQDFRLARAQGLVGQVEANYLVGEGAYVKLGYERTLSPVPVYGVLRNDRVYLDARWVFGPKLRVKGFAAYDDLGFVGSGARRDDAFSLDVAPEYELGSWLTAGGGFIYSVRRSDLAVASLNFSRSELYVRLTASY